MRADRPSLQTLEARTRHSKFTFEDAATANHHPGSTRAGLSESCKEQMKLDTRVRSRAREDQLVLPVRERIVQAHHKMWMRLAPMFSWSPVSWEWDFRLIKTYCSSTVARNWRFPQ